MEILPARSESPPDRGRAKPSAESQEYDALKIRTLTTLNRHKSLRQTLLSELGTKGPVRGGSLVGVGGRLAEPSADAGSRRNSADPTDTGHAHLAASSSHSQARRLSLKKRYVSIKDEGAPSSPGAGPQKAPDGPAPLVETAENIRQALQLLARLPSDSSGGAAVVVRVKNEATSLLCAALTACNKAGHAQGGQGRAAARDRQAAAGRDDWAREKAVLESRLAHLNEELRKARASATWIASPRSSNSEKDTEKVGALKTVPNSALSSFVYLTPRGRSAPEGDVTLVATQIEHAAELWAADPAATKASLQLQNKLFRKLLVEGKGYESRADGDCALYAFEDAEAAITWCVSCQQQLLHVTWPPGLLRLAHGAVVCDDAGSTVFKGLRVKMGVHRGSPTMHPVEKSARVHYHGPDVRRARILCARACGGEILTTSELAGSVPQSVLDAAGAAMAAVDGGTAAKPAPECGRVCRVLPSALLQCRGRVYNEVVSLLAEHAPPALDVLLFGSEACRVRRERLRAEGAVEHAVSPLHGLVENLLQTLRLLKVHEQKETPQREAERRRRDSCSGLIPEAHPPVGDVAFLFTAVENAAALWDEDPKGMSERLKVHNDILRDAFRQRPHACFEVKAEGDSFMVAFHAVDEALATAKLIQTALSQAEWPAPRRNPGGSGELRVQMGVHYGRPTAERDRSTHRVVYLGPVVHRASYACCYAKGGELVMTDDAFQELSQLEISGWDSADLGPVALPDFVSRTVLHSFVPRKPKSTAAPAVQEPRGPFPCGRIDVAAPHAPFAQVPLSSHWKVSLQDTRARIQAACDEISGYVLPQHQLRQPAQAPPPKGTVCFVFCDVEATQDMWSRASDAMKPALSSLQQVLSGLLASHGGYPVASEGDGLSAAFSSAEAAIAFCNAAHVELLAVEWPAALRRFAASMTSPSSKGESLWHGLRLKIGVHQCSPACHEDSATGRMDYYGPDVDVAAQLAGLGCGGETVVSEQLLSALQLKDVETVKLGQRRLPGTNRRVDVASIYPRALAERKEARLRPRGTAKDTLQHWWSEAEDDRRRPAAGAPLEPAPQPLQAASSLGSTRRGSPPPARPAQGNAQSAEAIGAAVTYAVKAVHAFSSKANARRRSLGAGEPAAAEKSPTRGNGSDEPSWISQSIALTRSLATCLRSAVASDASAEAGDALQQQQQQQFQQLLPGPVGGSRFAPMASPRGKHAAPPVLGSLSGPLLAGVDHAWCLAMLDEVLGYGEDGFPDKAAKDRNRAKSTLSRLKHAALSIGRKRLETTRADGRAEQALGVLRVFFQLAERFLASACAGAADAFERDWAAATADVAAADASPSPLPSPYGSPAASPRVHPGRARGIPRASSISSRPDADHATAGHPPEGLFTPGSLQKALKSLQPAGVVGAPHRGNNRRASAALPLRELDRGQAMDPFASQTPDVTPSFRFPAVGGVAGGGVQSSPVCLAALEPADVRAGTWRRPSACLLPLTAHDAGDPLPPAHDSTPPPDCQAAAPSAVVACVVSECARHLALLRDFAQACAKPPETGAAPPGPFEPPDKAQHNKSSGFAAPLPRFDSMSEGGYAISKRSSSPSRSPARRRSGCRQAASTSKEHLPSELSDLSRTPSELMLSPGEGSLALSQGDMSQREWTGPA
ncbi:hypothetical protein DIPPA_01877 [Diplonema papillatum]|nr:hypothetical protein DIPPA_01877 [Diplonema papillatum]